MLLAKLRPLIEEFLNLTDIQHCDRIDLGADASCRVTPNLDRGQWCFRCRYVRIAESITTL